MSDLTKQQREWLDWTRQQADGSGDCDRCHDTEVALWSLPQQIEAEEGAHWMYCATCFRALVIARGGEFE